MNPLYILASCLSCLAVIWVLVFIDLALYITSAVGAHGGAPKFDESPYFGDRDSPDLSEWEETYEQQRHPKTD